MTNKFNILKNSYLIERIIGLNGLHGIGFQQVENHSVSYTERIIYVFQYLSNKQ